MVRLKAADMAKWTQEQKDKTAFIVRHSIEDVSAMAQTSKAKGGRMPVDKRQLQNSFTSGLNGSTALTGPEVYIATLDGFEVGDTFNAGWTAAHALRMEKGFVGQDKLGRTFNQPGNFFMESALANWQAINDANAAKVK